MKNYFLILGGVALGMGVHSLMDSSKSQLFQFTEKQKQNNGIALCALSSILLFYGLKK